MPDDPAIEKLRTRQIKNFFGVTMLSAGMPTILMGDEVHRTGARPVVMLFATLR